MKKTICLLLCFALLGCLLGCRQEEPEKPAEFFYLRSGFSYSSEQSVIGSEIRETAGFSGYKQILNLYLQGPKTNTLSPTFPQGSQIVSLSQGSNSVSMVVTDAFAALTGIELSAACICLSKTVIHLTGCSAVTIQAQTLPLDGNKNMTLDETGVLLYDNYYGQPKSE